MSLSLGDLLRDWRKNKRLSYKELAGLAGVSEATLARWENGRTQPRLAELEAALTALQVSANQRQQALAGMQAPRAVKRLRTEADGNVPVSGDLLRAMRMRRGWTQQETAQQAGISQGTLAKWERSEDWPAVERLHTLCYLLQAQEAELIALTQGLRVETCPSPEPDSREELEYRLGQILFASALADLEFLEMERLLWGRAQQREAALVDLNYVYGCHARFLAERGRYVEAADYVRRAGQSARDGFRDVVGWQSALLAAARIAGNSRRPDPARGIKILLPWLDNIPSQASLGHHAWMYSEVARLMVKLDYKEQALACSRRAIRMVESASPMEWWHRRADHVRLLVEMGHYHAALEECDWCVSHRAVGAEGLPLWLTRAKTLLALRKTAEAREQLQQIDAGINAYTHLNHFRAEADALAEAL